MCLAKIDAIIAAIRDERYRWTPVRRVSIEKQHSTKLRPLGLPSWSDKLLQEVLRLILEAYFEPQFSTHAHGFRPGRGCHTALREIYDDWAGTTWLIEGDISACFDSLDHDVLLATLTEHIHDGRLLRLIRELLQAGYLEDWKWHATLSGAPQGAILSPVLTNIYLSTLDRFVETTLLPAHTRGSRRRPNPAYVKLSNALWRGKERGKLSAMQALRQQRATLPSGDPFDPEYRRLRYCRYADDFLLGFIGPREEAEQIKQHLQAFLRERLKLELSDVKTLVTHARTEAAQFLGYEIATFHRDAVRERTYHRRRVLNGKVALALPRRVLTEHCRRSMRGTTPIHRPELVNDTVFSIIASYQAAYRGMVEYYRLAYNLHRWNRLKWLMEQSLTKTLASKLKISVSKVYERFRATLWTEGRPYKGLQTTIQRDGKPPLVAQWGGIPLRRRMDVALHDAPPRVWNTRTELVQRLLADTCELCGSHDAIEVHHIRALKDLQRHDRPSQPAWVRVMATRQRKTLVVCRPCHRSIHQGRPGPSSSARHAPEGNNTGEPCDAKVSSTVRRGAAGKVPGATA